MVSFRPFRFVVSGFSTCPRKQVCRLSLKTEQAIIVARGRSAKIESKKEQVQFIQSNFFTNKPRVIKFYSPVLRLRSLQRRETTSSIVERRKQVSKRALITS